MSGSIIRYSLPPFVAITKGEETASQLSHVSEDGNSYIAFPTENALTRACRFPRESIPSVAIYDLSGKELNLTEVWQGEAETGGTGLAEIIRQKPIETLLLNGNRLHPSVIPLLSQVLLTNPALTRLDLDKCKIPNEHLTLLAKALLTNTQLAVLHLNETIPLFPAEREMELPGGFAAAMMAQALVHNHALAILGLARNHLTAGDAYLIGEALKQNRTLIAIDLSDNPIGDEGAEAIATALLLNATLNRLDLGSCQLNEKGALAIAQALTAKHALTVLNLRNNCLDKTFGSIFGKLLGTDYPLQMLDLENCALTPAGSQAIGTALCTNSRLLSLKLSNNAFDNEAADCIANGLRENSTLEELSLFSGQLTEIQGEKIASSLMYNTALRTLILGDNCLQYESVCNALHSTLNTNSTLVSIGQPLHQFQLCPGPYPLVYPRPSIRNAIDALLIRNQHNDAYRKISLFKWCQRTVCKTDFLKLPKKEQELFLLTYQKLSGSAVLNDSSHRPVFEDWTLFWKTAKMTELLRHPSHRYCLPHFLN